MSPNKPTTASLRLRLLAIAVVGGAVVAVVLGVRAAGSSEKGVQGAATTTAEPPTSGSFASRPALPAVAKAATKSREALYAELQGLRDLLVTQGDSALVGHKLRALFVETPEAAELVMDLLSEGVDHETATTLVFELGQAGTSQAQGALADIYEGAEQSTRLRRQALIAAGGVAEANASTRDSMWAIFAETSSGVPAQLGPAALLGLGRIGANLRTQGAEAYQEQRSRLVAVLAGSTDERTTILALKALGNTHDPSLVSTLATYLVDASPRIRATAAETLGRLGGPEASGLLLGRLLSEQVGWVRRNVVVGMYNLDEPSEMLLSTLGDLVDQEQDDTVRTEMRRVLEKNGAS